MLLSDVLSFLKSFVLNLEFHTFAGCIYSKWPSIWKVQWLTMASIMA